MHNLLYIVIVAALATLTASAPEPPKQPAPQSGAFARIDHGCTMAVQNGFGISFIDDGGTLNRMELRSPCVIRPGKCSFSNRFVFMPDIGCGVVHKNGKFYLSGCAVFDRSGKTVREFPTAETAIGRGSSPSEIYFAASGAFFIDEYTVAVKTAEGTFLYNIAENSTVMKNRRGGYGRRRNRSDEHRGHGNEHYGNHEHRGHGRYGSRTPRKA